MRREEKRNENSNLEERILRRKNSRNIGKLSIETSEEERRIGISRKEKRREEKRKFKFGGENFEEEKFKEYWQTLH